MSGFDAERKAIDARFSTQWGSTTPVKYHDKPFNQPSNSPWAWLTVRHGDSRNRNLNSDINHVAVIFIQIFIPEDSLTPQDMTLADSAYGIFSNQEFSGIVCWASSITEAGTRNGWYQINVTTPFVRGWL